MTPEQVRARYEDIVDVLRHPGRGDFIALPMRTYSSGMAARLRFSIAAARTHDVLLIDEALATGDAAFRRRSEERIRELREAAGTVFLVSHSPEAVRATCQRALWVDAGRLRDGRHARTTSWTRTSARPADAPPGQDGRGPAAVRSAVGTVAEVTSTTTSPPTALVVGATGIAGRALCRPAPAARLEVLGLSRRAPVDLPGVTPVLADLTDADGLAAALAGHGPTHVFITAWAAAGHRGGEHPGQRRHGARRPRRRAARRVRAARRARDRAQALPRSLRGVRRG